MFCGHKRVFVVHCFMLLLSTTSAYSVEINSPLAPITPPRNAPLPHARYGEPQVNRNYNPEQTIPGSPTFKLDTGPDINHQQWCNDRYRSYRSTDNTYIDRGGVRQTCKSPFAK